MCELCVPLVLFLANPDEPGQYYMFTWPTACSWKAPFKVNSRALGAICAPISSFCPVNKQSELCYICHRVAYTTRDLPTCKQNYK